MNSKTYLTGIGSVGLLMWIWGAGTMVVYSSTKPHVPLPEQGRTYQINNHGAIAYLTRSEYWRVWGIADTGWAVAAVAAIVGLVQRRAERKDAATKMIEEMEKSSNDEGWGRQ
jgi:hypothetical protein